MQYLISRLKIQDELEYALSLDSDGRAAVKAKSKQREGLETATAKNIISQFQF